MLPLAPAVVAVAAALVADHTVVRAMGTKKSPKEAILTIAHGLRSVGQALRIVLQQWNRDRLGGALEDGLSELGSDLAYIAQEIQGLQGSRSIELGDDYAARITGFASALEVSVRRLKNGLPFSLNTLLGVADQARFVADLLEEDVGATSPIPSIAGPVESALATRDDRALEAVADRLHYVAAVLSAALQHYELVEARCEQVKEVRDELIEIAEQSNHLESAKRERLVEIADRLDAALRRWESGKTITILEITSMSVDIGGIRDVANEINEELS